MLTIKTINEMRFVLRTSRPGKRVGLVPTMGNLHDGHIALVEACKRRADI